MNACHEDEKPSGGWVFYLFVHLIGGRLVLFAQLTSLPGTRTQQAFGGRVACQYLSGLLQG